MLERRAPFLIICSKNTCSTTVRQSFDIASLSARKLINFQKRQKSLWNFWEMRERRRIMSRSKKSLSIFISNDLSSPREEASPKKRFLRCDYDVIPQRLLISILMSPFFCWMLPLSIMKTKAKKFLFPALRWLNAFALLSAALINEVMSCHLKRAHCELFN